MTADELAAASVDELERLYREAPLGPEPRGVFRGRMLRYLSPPLAFKALDWLMFDLPPYGIDFDRRAWWFVSPKLRSGRFDFTAGPSRWRRTETLRLEYGASRLPQVVRGLLYDEVKPLAGDLCLGLGGINRPAGSGEHFYFALTR
jgi:hypothetical protein